MLAKGTPLLTGTNGTYLYQYSRETDDGPDDVRGDAFEHFIVLSGYRSEDQSMVATNSGALKAPARSWSWRARRDIAAVRLQQSLWPWTR